MRPNPVRLALALLAWGCLLAPARGQTPAAPTIGPATATAAGVVKRSQGEVSIERAGQRLAAAPGASLMTGDTVRTGPAGAAGITLRDDTLMTLGPDSELVISNFAFDATTHDGNLLTSLWRGTLHMVTGLIARKTPERVNVQTRTMVLGARGTEFIVETQAGAVQK